jgi:hypothetical protein
MSTPTTTARPVPVAAVPTSRAALIGALGAAITAVGALATQLLVVPTTDVSDERWSYPWSGEALVRASLLWAVASALVLVGLVGLSRSGVAGRTRLARLGLSAALAGNALILVGQFGSILVRDQFSDDSGATAVASLFGLATVLLAAGFLLTGVMVLRAGHWRGWRRFTALATGVSGLILLGLAVTPHAVNGGIALYGLCLVALFVALATAPGPGNDEGRP